MRTTEDLVNRLRAAFLQMPRLRLTPEHVQRLYGIEHTICRIVLDLSCRSSSAARKSRTLERQAYQGSVVRFRLRADVIRSDFFTARPFRDKTEERINGIHHSATAQRIAQEAEAEAEDREQVVADAEHGTQGEAGGTRGEAGGGNRSLTGCRSRWWARPHRHDTFGPQRRRSVRREEGEALARIIH